MLRYGVAMSWSDHPLALSLIPRQCIADNLSWVLVPPPPPPPPFDVSPRSGFAQLNSEARGPKKKRDQKSRGMDGIKEKGREGEGDGGDGDGDDRPARPNCSASMRSLCILVERNKRKSKHRPLGRDSLPSPSPSPSESEFGRVDRIPLRVSGEEDAHTELDIDIDTETMSMLSSKAALSFFLSFYLSLHVCSVACPVVDCTVDRALASAPPLPPPYSFASDRLSCCTRNPQALLWAGDSAKDRIASGAPLCSRRLIMGMLLNVWSGPRSLSTSLLYSFAQVDWSGMCASRLPSMRSTRLVIPWYCDMV